LEITATIYYQSVPAKGLEEMFSETSPEIDLFKTMYQNADRSPVLVKEATLEVEEILSGVNDQQAVAKFVKVIRLSGNEVLVRSTARHDVALFDLNGKQLKAWKGKLGDYKIELPKEKGMYLLRFMNGEGEVQVEKVL